MNQFFYLSTPLIVSIVIAFIALVVSLLVEYTGVVLNRKRFLIALGLSSLFYALAGLFGMSSEVNDSFWYFLLLMSMSLGIGIWLAILLRKRLFSDASPDTYVNYVLMLAFVGFNYAAFSLVFNFFAHSDLGYHYGTAIFISYLPLVFIPTLDYYLAIPDPLYKVWYIDESREEPDFEDVNIKNIMLTT